jgi:hypothetical protein
MNIVIDDENAKAKRVTNPAVLADSVMAFRNSQKFGLGL